MRISTLSRYLLYLDIYEYLHYCVQVPVLNIVGEHSPHLEASLATNLKLGPATSTWLKVGEAGMVLEEQPEKVAEALSLFLQGLGYTLNILRSKSASVRPSKLDLRGINEENDH